MTKLAETIGLTDVQNEIISTVRQFVEKEVIPAAPELERTDTYPQAIVDQMRDMGLFGLMIPQEYGGLGESLLSYALCVEELARGWMSISGVLNTHFIVAYMLRQHGTDAQKQRLLPRMAIGEVRGAFSMSEPELGSDVAAIRTRATLNSDGNYTITGQKMWVTNGASSTLVAAWARTGEGFYQMMDGIEVGRVNVSARAVGVAVRAFELAVRYAQQRHTFGRAIAEHQAIAFQI